MAKKTIRILDHEITRRDAIKAGGVVGLGLAFSKPLISTLRPKAAFGQASYDPCATDFTSPEITEAFSFPQFTYTVVDPGSGLQSIQVVVLDPPNVTFTIPPFAPCTTDSVEVTVGPEDTGADAFWEIVTTDCCGNVTTQAGEFI